MISIGLLGFLAWMAFVVLSGVVFLVWAIRSGQFKDVEEPKYRMLEDREPEPWPHQVPKGGKSDAPHRS